MGDELQPEAISLSLGVAPTAAWRKGENLAPAHRPVQLSRSGYWKLEATPTEPENLDVQVHELLSAMTLDLNVWRHITRTYRVDLFCGWFMRAGNEGVEISPETLKALGERGISLGLDIYAPTSDE